MDPTQYTDEELEAIAGGASAQGATDYTDEELAQIAGEPAAPKEPWFEAGPLRIENSPMDVDWGKAIVDKATDYSNPSAAAGVANPLLTDLAAPTIAKGIGKVGQFIKRGAEAFATTPHISKAITAITPSTYMGGGGMGRAAGYMMPVVQKLQATADTLNVANKAAQKSIAYALDHTPEVLGKFATVLKNAAASGPTALATTDFLLSQKDPEYQSMKRKLHE